MQGRDRHEMSGLEVEQPWDSCESAGLEAKELGEQVANGPELYLESG